MDAEEPSIITQEQRTKSHGKTRWNSAVTIGKKLETSPSGLGILRQTLDKPRGPNPLDQKPLQTLILAEPLY